MSKSHRKKGDSLAAASLVVALLLVGVGHAFAGVTVTYYHTDVLGSPIAATDQDGVLKWSERYKPYGERIDVLPAADENDLFYTGKPHDEDTGLTYFGARHYDPIVGRFMGIDPLGVREGNVHTFNMYAYANNNPYRYTDPNGLWVEDAIIGVPSLILGGASLVDNISNGNWGWRRLILPGSSSTGSRSRRLVFQVELG